MKSAIDCEKLLENSEDGILEVIVKYNGAGIMDDDQQKLFKLFGYLD